jgi:hypothetical protein
LSSHLGSRASWITLLAGVVVLIAAHVLIGYQAFRLPVPPISIILALTAIIVLKHVGLLSALWGMLRWRRKRDERGRPSYQRPWTKS